LVKQRQDGYSLLEMVVALAIFGMFCAVLFQLTAEMRFYEKRLPVNYHKHPQVIAVLARMRRDVMDAHGRTPYRNSFGPYTASEKVLIVEIVAPAGGVDTVVWDFRTAREVHRIAFHVGVPDQWIARGLPPDFSNVDIEAIRINENAAWATHIVAKDDRGRIAIDTILQPRATE
jgi:prepilin-type N-terminal cleavage/methylation domain-containing protein